MSSRVTVPAWVIEKQQKQIALKREAERKKQVRQQIAKVATAVRADMAGLNSEEVNTWAKEEIEFVQHSVDSTVSIAEADVPARSAAADTSSDRLMSLLNENDCQRG